MKRLLIAVVAIGLLAAVGCYFLMGGEDEALVVAQEYQEAVDLLAAEDPEGALDIILSYSHRSDDDEGPWHDYNWEVLEIDAAEQMKSIPRLIYLFKKNQQAFDGKEETVLMLARIFLQFQQIDDYDLLRNHWRGQEVLEKPWFLLDADFLMFQKKGEEATAFLETKEFEGEEDIPRLIRLALLASKNNLQEAWGYLTTAYTINPKSPEVRAFRAQILESVGQIALARVEFMATVAADPENPKTRDQLAQFYRRNRQMNLALDTWKVALDEFSADFIWSQAYFWNRLIVAHDYDWKNQEVPNGNLRPWVEYMISLPEGKWWDEERFRVLPETRFYLTTRQETFWFRLFHELQEGNEAAALSLLEQNHFSSQSWHPDLESAFVQILSYRLTGKLPLPPETDHGVPRAQGGNGEKLYDPANGRHPFFTSLLDLAESGEEVSEELDSLLRSNEVFSAALLAAKWFEGAVAFNRLEFIPEVLPTWVAHDLIQAIQLTQGSGEALEFAKNQTTSPEILMLKAKLLIAEDRTEEGITLMQKVAEEDTPVALRASWALATYYAEQGDFNRAKITLIEKPTLGRSVVGKELLARIAFLEGDLVTAEAMYTALQNKSFIAKSFLAKLAFDRKDYTKAREITMEMIKQYPDVLELRANLKAIVDAEKGITADVEQVEAGEAE